MTRNMSLDHLVDNSSLPCWEINYHLRTLLFFPNMDRIVYLSSFDVCFRIVLVGNSSPLCWQTNCRSHILDFARRSSRNKMDVWPVSLEWSIEPAGYPVCSDLRTPAISLLKYVSIRNEMYLGTILFELSIDPVGYPDCYDLNPCMWTIVYFSYLTHVHRIILQEEFPVAVMMDQLPRATSLFPWPARHMFHWTTCLGPFFAEDSLPLFVILIVKSRSVLVWGPFCAFERYVRWNLEY